MIEIELSVPKIGLRRIADGFPGERHVKLPSEVQLIAAEDPIFCDLFPTALGYFRFADNHYRERPDGIAECILIACVAGTGVCDIGGAEWLVEPGDVIFLPANTPHKYRASRSDPWSILWFHYVGRKHSAYESMVGVSCTNPVIRVTNTGAIVSAFEDVYESTQHGYGRRSLFGIATSFARFMSQCSLHRRSQNAPSTKVEEKIFQCAEFMKKNFHRDLLLSDLAAIAGLTPTYFSHLFHKQMDASPFTYLARLRLQAACSLLQQTDRSITEISSSVGYSDPYYFSKVFRKHYGFPPSKYRKKFLLQNFG